MQDYIKLKQQLEILWQEVERMERENPEPGPGGTSDYTELTNKPSINGVELNGNKTLTQLGIAPAATTYTKTEVDGEIIGAITDLDVSSTAATGHYIKSIAQEDGLIVPVAETLATSPVPSSEKPITSDAVYTALSDKANSADVYNKTQVDEKVTALTAEDGSLADRGAKNLAKFDIWAKNCSIVRGTKAIDTDGSITITATSSDCYTLFSPTDFPVECRIPVTPGTEMVATWTASETGTGNKYIYFFPNGASSGSIAVKASDGTKTFTIPAGCSYLTWRIGCSTSGDTLTVNNLMVCTKADYDASSTYVPYAPTNRQLYVSQTGYTAESANGSFSALIHNAATYCGVDDSQEVNGFVVFTSSVASENLIGFFNFKYLRNVAFSPVISNTITYSAQSQYGTVTVTGGTGPYKAVVKFI